MRSSVNLNRGFTKITILLWGCIRKMKWVTICRAIAHRCWGPMLEPHRYNTCWSILWCAFWFDSRGLQTKFGNKQRYYPRTRTLLCKHWIEYASSLIARKFISFSPASVLWSSCDMQLLVQAKMLWTEHKNTVSPVTVGCRTVHHFFEIWACRALHQWKKTGR